MKQHTIKYIPIEVELACEIKAFCEETGMSHYKFGMRVFNDHKIMSRILGGKPVYSDTINRARKYMYSTFKK